MPKRKKNEEAPQQQTPGDLANPHFIKCLKELIEDAKRKKQDKLKMTYFKALRSMQKYPLVLRSGDEAKALEGIGPVLAKKLDQFLEQHPHLKPNMNANVNNSNATISSQQQNESSDTEEKPKRKKRKVEKKPATSVEPPSMMDANYAPKYKSAVWAILIVMYKEHKAREAAQKPLMYQKLTKSDIVTLAQPWTDTPMIPPSASKFSNKNGIYCGWSCMKQTLLPKALVEETRCMPKRYELTRVGRALARKLYRVECATNTALDALSWTDADDNADDDEVALMPESDDEKEMVPTSSDMVIELSDSDKDGVKDSISANNIASTSTTTTITTTQAQLFYEIHYVDFLGIPVARKDEAQVTIKVDAGGLCFAVQATLALDMSHALESSTWIIHDRKELPSNQLLIKAWIPDEHATDLAGDLHEQFKHVKIRQKIAQVAEKQQEPRRKKEKVKKRDNITPSTISTTIDIPNRIDYRALVKEPKTQQQQQSSSTTFPYKIVLYLDNRERSHNDRHYLFTQLCQKNITCEVKGLALGDALWALRPEKAQNDEQDVLLQYIVERKSMEDLASSIIDGRYKEQKFRLKEMGLANIYYLIEGELKHQSRLPVHHIETAIIHTQVVDGFFVKRCQTLDRSIEYLAILTRKIEKLVHVQGKKKHLLYNEETSSGMTLKQFNKQAAKNSALTFEHIFGRQLCVIHGCSVNVAESILKQYPVPKMLWEAYQNTNSAKERQMLLHDVLIYAEVLDIPIRKLGKSMSHLLCNLFCAEKYE